MSFFEYLGKNPIYVIIVCVAFALCIVAALIKYPFFNAMNRKNKENMQNLEDDADTFVDNDENGQLNSLVENEKSDEQSSEEQDK